MRFIVDANLPRGLAEAIRTLGHEATDVRDTPLGTAPDPDIDAYARAERCCLLTLDWDFADVRSYPPQDRAGIVVFEPIPNATWRQVHGMVLEFVANPELTAIVSGSLMIVGPARVRIRRGGD
jgi:predicted nuclease of predicted toxin-antitoxin system